MKITFITTTNGNFNTFETMFPTYGDFKMTCDAMKPAIEMAYRSETGEILYLKSQDRGV